MAEGQVAQAFGGKPQNSAEFKTESGLGVKVYAGPASAWVTGFERWLKDNEIHDFSHSLTEANGILYAIITYRKNPKTGVEETVRDTVTLLIDLVKEINDLADAVSQIKQDANPNPEVRVDSSQS